MKEQHLSADEMFKQLAVIKRRLEGYPMAHKPEAQCLKDCVLLLIRTIAGERIPATHLATIGGGVMEAQGTERGREEVIGGQILRGGVEIAPGVVQYPPAPNAAPVDVEMGRRMTEGQMTPTTESGMPRALPGSIMALAQSGGSVEAEPKQAKAGNGIPAGIPSPSETRVEITNPGESS